VVTGVGAITPIGSGFEGLWAGVRRGTSAVRGITRFDPSPFSSQIAAQVDDFDPCDYLEARRARRLDRFSQLAVAASRQALDHAVLSLTCDEREAAAVYLGSALGGIAFGEEQHTNYLARGVRGVESTLALSVFGGAGATNVALEFGFNGPTLGNANSCASGLIALGEAFRLIRDGRAEVALAGGAEAPLAPLSFGAFALIRAMSRRNEDAPHACRPFDMGRDGFVMAEGAAMFVLESGAHAAARGAEPLFEILGYGTTNDAYHMTAPLPTATQAARAMTLALAEAGLPPHTVDYVNAHATGTPLGDAAEARAVQLVFGDQAPGVPVSGTKGLHGHALGATGAIEVAITGMALRTGWFPPTANLDEPDPACIVTHVPPEGLTCNAAIALTNAFGFGGINASLVLARAQLPTA
jgi:3-oxoacyl-[acyl-carrier-protein] synthase II